MKLTQTLLEWVVTSAALILVVLALRALLGKRVSARLRYALWAVVLVRLSAPFQNVVFRRKRMSFFTGQHTGVIQPYTPHHLPA